MKEEVANFVATTPERAALVPYSAADDGNVVADGQSLFVHADAPLDVASVVKIVVLAAYAGAVAETGR